MREVSLAATSQTDRVEDAKRCPICASANLVVCADLGLVPVYQNARYPDMSSARNAAQGRLVLAACRTCGFAFNAGFDPDLARYDVSYDNNQMASGQFAGHVDRVARRAWSVAGAVQNPTVLEVGCGQGTFLRLLNEVSGRRIDRLIGFDPSLSRPISEGPLRLEPRSFDAQAACGLGGAAELAVVRHVIEHVHPPVDLLRAIRSVLVEGAGRILVETPCFDWILKKGAWHDVFYEHCNYFTADSLAFALEQAGFTDVVVEHLFEGQYLLASARHDPAPLAKPPPDGEALAARAQAFGQSLDAYVNGWRERFAGGQALAIWGAGAKGVTFAILSGDKTPLRCLVDIDPKKQNTYAPQSGLPIIAPARLPEFRIGTVVVMNPNYAEEVRRAIADLPIEVVVMDEDR